MKKRNIYQFLFITIFILCYSSGMAQVLNIAHRGGAALAPENTLGAFSNAIQLKADYFELDVQMSKDDSLMIMHDASIDRTTNGLGNVNLFTYAQLKNFDAGSKFSAAFAGEKIPSLYESLMLAKNSTFNIGVVIEIKTANATAVQKVVALVQKLKMEKRVIIASFNLAQVTEAKTIDPTIPVMVFGSSNTNALIDQYAAAKIDWYGSSGVPTKAFTDYAHSKGVKFNIWTINGAAQMAAYILLGVDAITTDNPATFKAVTDVTPPTDVNVLDPTVVETKVTLKWNAASDPESAITGYNIYRDVNPSPTTLLASVGNILEYIDETFTETQKYYYRVKAKNTAGLLSVNFSNEVSATTLADVTKPVVLYITSNTEDSKINIEFNERVDQTTAETITNYTINKSVTVSVAKLMLDLKTVKLTTSAIGENSYSVTVKSVKDKAKTPNTMVTSSSIMIHKNLSINTLAFYSLDEIQQDSVLTDATINANNGILKNGPVLTEGKIGNALKFDGIDDYVQFAASPSFDFGGSAVTVSLWTKLTFLPADLPAAFGPLFDSDADQYVLYEDRGNNELRFKVSTSASAERPGIPAASLVTGEWIHVVGVYDGATAKIYLNGVLMDTHNLTGTVKTGQVAMLGRSGIASASYFNGSIDQVQILKSALSPAEVLELFKSVKQSPVDAKPSEVLLNSADITNLDVKLLWQPATNYESGLMYEIYRDTKSNPTVLLATVAGSVTQYIDKTAEENTIYYYRIRAKNTAGLFSPNYSNELTALMGKDTYKPVVLYSTSRAEDSKVVVEFNEKVEKASAETASNYTLDNSATVLSAKLALDLRSVILKTSLLKEVQYTLTVKNIKDRAAIPNTMVSENVKFNRKNIFPGIVSYYSIDELEKDSVLTDFTSNANNGVLKNGTLLSDGILGNALRFDGVDDYVQFNASSSFDMTSGFVTVSAWVKLDFLPTEMVHAFGPIFDSQGDQYVLYADKGNKELRFKVTTTAGAARPGIPQADLITGQWINVVGVYDGTNASIYLNGVKKGTLPLTGTIVTGQVLMLGKNGTTGTLSFFKGSIDNIHVFNRVLTQDEITDLYKNIKNENLNTSVEIEENGSDAIPVSFALSQNYPNPFNPLTKINYSLPVAGNIVIKLYDILGKEVAIIENGFRNAGNYTVSFDASHLASGVYIYKMVSGDFTATKKLLLLK